MSNPFSGIISAEFKQLHKNMIDALLEDDALTVPCKFVYTGTKFQQCTNCVYDPIGGKSSNVFLAGGPQYFHNGQTCPACGGEGVKPVVSSETIYMMVIWDSKSWYTMASNVVRIPEVMIQTMCKKEVYPKIMKVSYIEITDIEGNGTQRFMRHGDPEYLGFNSNDYALTMWKKV